MLETIIKIDGMMCGMCETHINDAIRNAFPVKKVRASRKRGLAVILSEQPIDLAALKTVVEKTGYRAGDAETHITEPKGLLGRK